MEAAILSSIDLHYAENEQVAIEVDLDEATVTGANKIGPEIKATAKAANRRQQWRDDVDRVHSDYANLRRRQQDATAQVQSTHVQPKPQSEHSTYSRIANNHDAKRDGISWPSRHSLGFQGAPAWARHRCLCQSVDNGY